MTTRWGLYDVREKCWYGADGGPKLFDQYDLAQVAANVAAKRLGLPYIQIQAKVYDGSGDKKRDEVPTLMSTSEALAELESGDTTTP